MNIYRYAFRSDVKANIVCIAKDAETAQAMVTERCSGVVFYNQYTAFKDVFDCKGPFCVLIEDSYCGMKNPLLIIEHV